MSIVGRFAGTVGIVENRPGAYFSRFTLDLSISACTDRRMARPGNVTSGATTSDSSGQYSAFPSHSVPASATQELLISSQESSLDLTMVEQFGQRVCMFAKR